MSRSLHQTFITLHLSLLLPFPGIAQQISPGLHFQTSKGWTVTVQDQAIRINGKELYPLKNVDVIVASKRNRLIEDAGTAFLFLEMDGSPNEDRLDAFQLAPDKITLVADAISSDLEDLDHDSFLEFGGCDLTEDYPARDSMYYIPFHYYEIRKGRVLYDSAYSRTADIFTNGVYLTNPYDDQGMCCRVIPKPGKKDLSILVDTGLVSERIDGPANVRDTVGGKLLFQLDDNIPVRTSDTVNKWCRIGLLVDVSPAQLRAGTIAKDSPLYSDGERIGIALETLPVRPSHAWHQESRGILTGYTAMNNIRSRTITEKLLSRIIRANGSMDISDLEFFHAAFRLSVIMDRPYGGLFLDESPLLCNGAHPTRILLLFHERRLYAVIHRRKMDYHGSKEYALNEGYTLTVVGQQNQRLIDTAIRDFNSDRR